MQLYYYDGFLIIFEFHLCNMGHLSSTASKMQICLCVLSTYMKLGSFYVGGLLSPPNISASACPAWASVSF